MRRLPDWPERLHAFLEANAQQPFFWGRNDCALFVADAVLAMTGDDLGAPFRGTYDTAHGAALALRKHGAGTLIRTLTAKLGKPVHPAFAQRGDVVLAHGEAGQCAGICIGGEALFVAEGGHIRLPRAFWSKAWRV